VYLLSIFAAATLLVIGRSAAVGSGAKTDLEGAAIEGLLESFATTALGLELKDAIRDLTRAAAAAAVPMRWIVAARATRWNRRSTCGSSIPLRAR
jgi:hypothetical protein